MPSTVERPVSANVVGHATEYPTDRERHDRDSSKRHSIESSAQPTDDTESEDAPAVVIEPHHLEDHLLDGVAAYRAVAKTILEPGYRPGDRHPLLQDQGKAAPVTVCHAYQDHKDDEAHAVNLAT